MKFSESKKILVTGGAGFIGRNIIEQLALKYVIFAPTEKELDLLDASAVEHFFKNHTFDVVIHAAHIGGYSLQESLHESAINNIRMFFNLARQLGSHQKMIFLGSGAEYDKRRDIISAGEDEFDKQVPTDSYGFTKYVCSKYIEQSNNIINLRCFGVYGKYEQPTRFISSAIISALKNEPITIHQNTYFDYLYVDDLVKIIDYFILHKPLHTFYNAASGKRVDLITLANMVKIIMASTKEILVEKSGLQKEYTANANRLNQETHLPQTSFEEGIKNLVQYYKNNV